jgi:hypothetical protein
MHGLLLGDHLTAMSDFDRQKPRVHALRYSVRP